MDTKASLRWNVYDDRCPTRLVLGRLADKWTVLVVGQLAHGLITRRVYASVPPKVEYTLTPLGRTLISLVEDIRVWAETHIEAVLDAQLIFDRQTQEVEEPV
jgi:DNA-binding HxlR family transcriptional regulator